jgi:hypothetical protein
MPKLSIHGKDKLNRHNHSKWKRKVTDAFRSEDPDIVQLLERRFSPWEYDHNGNYTRRPPRRMITFMDKIYGKLCSTLSDEMTSTRRKFEKGEKNSLKDPHAFWRFLDDNANTKTAGEIAQEKATAYDIKSDSPVYVRTQLEDIQARVSDNGFPMTEAELQAAFLKALEAGPYEHMVDTYKGKHDITFHQMTRAFEKKEESKAKTDKITKKNLQEARRLHAISLRDLPETRRDRSASPKTTKKNNKGDRKPCENKECGKFHRGACWWDDECDLCGKPGHIAKHCKDRRTKNSRRRRDEDREQRGNQRQRSRRRSRDSSNERRRSRGRSRDSTRERSRARAQSIERPFSRSSRPSKSKEDCQLCGSSKHRALQCPLHDSNTPKKKRRNKVVKKRELTFEDNKDDDEEDDIEQHVVDASKYQLDYHTKQQGDNEHKTDPSFHVQVPGTFQTTPSDLEATSTARPQARTTNDLQIGIQSLQTTPSHSYEDEIMWLLLDTAAQAHVTHDKQILHRIQPCNILVRGQIAQRVFESKGRALLRVNNDGQATQLLLKNVILQEDSQFHILATTLFETNDTCLTQTRGHFRLRTADGRVIIAGEKDPKSGMYWMKATVVRSTAVNTISTKIDSAPMKAVIHERIHENKLLLWHQRLGHASFPVVLAMYKLHLAEGVVLNKINYASLCTTCMKAKQQRSKVAFGEPKAICGVGEYFHVDICVMTTPTIHGELYGVAFTDDRAHYHFGHLKKSTANLHEDIEALRMFLLNQRSIKLKRIRCDQQFVTKPIQALCKQHGIELESAPADEHNYNPISERFIKTIQNMVFAMIKGAAMTLIYWGYAFLYSIYVTNRLPTNTMHGYATPYAAWNNGRIPTLKFVKTFGCLVMKYTNKKARAGKMNDKAEPCVNLGYDPTNSVYRLARLNHGGAITTGASVSFDEGQGTIWKDFDRSIWNKQKIQSRITNKRKADNKPIAETQEPRKSKRTKTTAMEVYQKQHPDEIVNLHDHHLAASSTTLCGRDKSKPQGTPAMDWYRREYPEETVNLHTQEIETMRTPKSFWEVLSSPQRPEWWWSMKDEIKSHVKHGSHELVDRPRDIPVLQGLWTYKRKQDGTAKSRYCARGDQQEFPRDYQETNSPTLRMESLKLILSQIALKGWKAISLDVKTAFLNADIDRVVYMEPPPGFRKDRTKCWRLLKAIYGLKQASRLFNELFCAHATKEMGFTQCEKDRCLFVKFTIDKNSTEQTTIMALSTDDIIITGSDDDESERTKKMIMDRFESRDMGEPQSYLGMEIKRDGNTIKLSQREYIEKILAKFQCQNAKPAATPMQENLKDSASTQDEAPVKFPFKECVGSLWHATITRPEILMALSKVSQNQENPCKADVVKVKRIMKYLNGSLDEGITFFGDDDTPLFGIADASYAKEQRGRSRTGFMFIRAGAAVICKSQVQKGSPAQSATEAEYTSGSEAVRKGLWIIELMRELHFEVQLPVRMQLDNQQSIFMAQDVAAHCRTMHIKVKELLLTHHTRNGTFEPQYVPSSENPADLFTKPLGKEKFKKHRATILGKHSSDQYSLSRHIFTASRQATNKERTVQVNSVHELELLTRS